MNAFQGCNESADDVEGGGCSAEKSDGRKRASVTDKSGDSRGFGSCAACLADVYLPQSNAII